MNTAAESSEQQRRKDDEQLKLLAVFHFVLAGLSLLMLGFLALHYFFMSTIFTNPEIWENAQSKGGGPPPEFIKSLFAVMVWFYIFGACFAVAIGMLNIFSGVFLRRKKYRTFSLIVAGVNCLRLPFGTALGVFSLVVLMRESVQLAYEREAEK
ncbi:MAG: hypothetical protein QM496_03700 [Verrucomicrobiota bacterium]